MITLRSKLIVFYKYISIILLLLSFGCDNNFKTKSSQIHENENVQNDLILSSYNEPDIDCNVDNCSIESNENLQIGLNKNDVFQSSQNYSGEIFDFDYYWIKGRAVNILNPQQPLAVFAKDEHTGNMGKIRVVTRVEEFVIDKANNLSTTHSYTLNYEKWMLGSLIGIYTIDPVSKAHIRIGEPKWFILSCDEYLSKEYLKSNKLSEYFGLFSKLQTRLNNFKFIHEPDLYIPYNLGDYCEENGFLGFTSSNKRSECMTEHVKIYGKALNLCK